MLALTVGRPYRGARADSLRARYPVVDYALRAKDIISPPGARDTGAAGRERAGEDADSGAARRPGKRIAGVNDKGALPADIPVHPKPVGETYSIGGGAVAAFQRVRGPAAPVVAYFRTEMPRRGWQRVSESTAGRATVLLWRKEGRSCRIEVEGGDGVTEVWLRSRAKR